MTESAAGPGAYVLVSGPAGLNGYERLDTRAGDVSTSRSTGFLTSSLQGTIRWGKIRHGCDTPLCLTPDCLEPGRRRTTWTMRSGAGA